MSDQSQTAANKPSEPVPCKMGCGFFGNSATAGCCSKCWLETQKKEMATAEAASPKKCQPVTAPSATQPKEETPKIAETVEKTAEAPALTEEKDPETPSEAPKKKKKGKKKLSYKSMMAGMMTAPKDNEKEEKEKDALKKVTGGGAFQKIDKI